MLRKPTAFFGIQARALLVTSAIGLLFIAYVTFSASQQATRDREHMTEKMRLVSDMAAARLDDHIGGLKRLLATLAGTIAIERNDVAANDAVLRGLAAGWPPGTSVSLWALDGRNIGSSGAEPPVGRPTAAGRKFFADAMRSTSMAIEAPLRLHEGGEWTAVFALPIIVAGRTVAVVSASTLLGLLPRLLDPEQSLSADAIVSLANAEATVIARSLDAERWIGQPAPIDKDVVGERLAEGHGNAESTGLDGAERIFGFTRSGVLPWLVYVGIPVDTALAASRARLRESLALGIVVIATGMLLAIWFSRRLTQPLRQLGRDARIFSEGRFDHRSRVQSHSEIGLLAQTLNHMAAAIEANLVAERHGAERLTLALESSDQALFDWDIAAQQIHYSARASTLRGGPDEATSMSPADMQGLVHRADIDTVRAEMRSVLKGEKALFDVEFRIRHRSGEWPWIRSRGRVVERDTEGRAARLVGTHADVSKRKAVEASLRQRAELDALTGLPNRALFDDRLAGAIERAARTGLGMALLFLDIDHFKGVNDTQGHPAGDALLQITARRLLAAVRSVDTVARLAGDEFTVILEGMGDPADAERVAAKIVEAVRAPMLLGDVSINVSVSLGLALLDSEDDAPGLVKRADQALYAAKRGGRDRYVTSAALN